MYHYIQPQVLAEPNVTVIEATVDDVIQDGDCIIGVTYTCKSGQKQSVRAPLTFLMDGINSKFRKHMTQLEPVTKSSFCGCIIEGCATLDANFAEVILTPTAPVLVYPIAPGLHRT